MRAGVAAAMFLALAAGGSSCPAAAGDAVTLTLRQVLTLDARPDSRETVTVFLRGTYDGFAFANTQLIQLDREPLFCPPVNFAPSPDELRERLAADLAQRRSRRPAAFEAYLRETPLALAVTLLLQREYPCG